MLRIQNTVSSIRRNQIMLRISKHCQRIRQLNSAQPDNTVSPIQRNQIHVMNSKALSTIRHKWAMENSIQSAGKLAEDAGSHGHRDSSGIGFSRCRRHTVEVVETEEAESMERDPKGASAEKVSRLKEPAKYETRKRKLILDEDCSGHVRSL
ncbi:hypothetical protein NE237_013900 [Protea cynaroides]|uniref:Uncharacterized protein n=1 Tax=Protea cynaroides TaxID=273540 RepID=A0A9Q0H3V6_9MAGN|nr:hypothetical protein NE237_013900 [Protea cynaroides]